MQEVTCCRECPFCFTDWTAMPHRAAKYLIYMCMYIRPGDGPFRMSEPSLDKVHVLCGMKRDGGVKLSDKAKFALKETP